MTDVIAGTSRPVYRVFLSSTYRDNKQRREIIARAIQLAGMQPVGMELFAADERPAKQVSLKMVEQGELYLGVIAWLYGWIPENEDKSITELEYERAAELGKDRLMFLLADDVKIDPLKDLDADLAGAAKLHKVRAFRQRVAREQTPRPFHDDELGEAVLHALTEWRRRKEELPSVSRPSSSPEGEERKERLILALPYDPTSREPIPVGLGTSATVFYQQLVAFDPTVAGRLSAKPDDHGFLFQLVLFMVVDSLFHPFGHSWDIEIESYVTPIDEGCHFLANDDAPGGKIVTWAEMAELFSNLDLFGLGFPDLAWMRLGDELVLPPEADLSWTFEPPTAGKLQIRTPFIDFCLGLSFHSWAPHLGSYRDLVADEVAERGETVTFDLELSGRFAQPLIHDPEMQRYRKWYENLHQFLREQFGWQQKDN